MSRKKIALLYGGRSVEHEISIRSAKNVAAYIDSSLFEVLLIGIDKAGDWYHTTEVTSEIASGDPISVQLKASKPQFIGNGIHFVPEIAFPILHGTDGEDGSIQGFFKALQIPSVGSGVLGSAISMDKIIAKKLMDLSGIPVSDYRYFSRSQRDSIDFNQLKNELGLPFMIKSSNLGSSVGVSKAINEETFINGIEEAFLYADEVLIESFIEGMEVECAIIGNDQPESTWPGEIHLKKEYDFYTYEAKYQDPDAIEMVIPTPLPEETMHKIRQRSIEAYKTLRCQDYARVDVFVTKSGDVYINEINTIPGFTNVSMFPSMWKNMGLSYPDLITKLINLAELRSQKESNLQTHYRKA